MSPIGVPPSQQMYAIMLAEKGNPEFARKETSRTTIEPTPEEIATHAEHARMLEILMESPTVEIIDWYVTAPHPRTEIVYAETHEEWSARIANLLLERTRA